MKSFFEASIWPLRGKLYRLVYSWTKDRDLSEDLLQNVFIKTIERQFELQTHPNLCGWLTKSLKNETLMYFRKNSHLDGLDELDDIPLAEDKSLESKEQNLALFRLIEGLPLAQKEVFLLREVEEMSYDEIARQLEISLEQVKINLHRARKSVRSKLITKGITP
jgi:RNA polymerase sigma factor (sigma-70 family)